MKPIAISFVSACIFLVSCKPAKSPDAVHDAAAPVVSTSSSIKPYLLDVCLVSGEKLGEMGAPIEMIYEGQQLKFCCKSCVPKFKNEPAKYLIKLK